MNRIIDHDINAYIAFVEGHQRDLYHAFPSQEARHIQLRDAAQVALDALKAYRAVMDEVQS